MDVDFTIGPEIIRAYERLSYKAWYALAEFVDNSTQSYFDNRAELDRTGEKLKVSITYDRHNGMLRIVDNAYGMSREHLVEALRIGIPPGDTSGRCEFGMGLKTSACWFGKRWRIVTKQLGHDKQYAVGIDVEKIVEGDTALTIVAVDKPTELHYTILEIEDLNRGLIGWAKRNSQEYLAAIYRRDILDGTLDLIFDNILVEPDIRYDDADFLQRVDGTLYRTEVDTHINGKHVTGWVGVLAPGKASRQRAGFTIFRRDRALATWRDAWKPENIFGHQRNDLINQRLAGELFLDDFNVSHTKDAILFINNEEEELSTYLKALADGGDLINTARRYKGDDIVVPSPAEKQVALEELKREMESPEFIDSIQVAEIPRPEIESIKAEPLIRDTSEGAAEPTLVVYVGESLTVQIFLRRYSYNDPYYAFQIGSDGHSILVVINESHPGWVELAGEEAFRTYLKHATFDAIAEWKCHQKTAELEPGSIRQIKDELFRQSYFSPGERDG